MFFILLVLLISFIIGFLLYKLKALNPADGMLLPLVSFALALVIYPKFNDKPLEESVQTHHKDIPTLNREIEELKQENKILHEKIEHLDSKKSDCVTICERY